jgi:DNA gyrase subunit A
VLARDGLMTQFGLSQIQAQAILDMQLQRLTGLERQKILDELAELLKRDRAAARDPRSDAADGDRRRRAARVRDKYGDARRTEIVDGPGEIRIEDLIADEDMAITVSNTGYIKRTATRPYSQQRRGGKGRIGMRTARRGLRQPPLRRVDARLHHDLLGPRPRLLAEGHEIPDVGPAATRQGDRQPGVDGAGEKIAALLAVASSRRGRQQFIVMGTRKGVVKKTDLTAFSNPRAGGIIAMGVEDDDAVIAVQQSDGRARCFIGTRTGRRSASRGRRAADGPHRLRRPRHPLRTTTKSWRWRSCAGRHRADGHRERLRQAHRRSRSTAPVARRLGIINIQTSDRNGVVVGIAYVTDEHELMLITQQGRRCAWAQGRPRHRPRHAGRPLIGVAEGDQVVSIVRLEDQGDGNGGAEPNGNGGGESEQAADVASDVAAPDAMPEPSGDGGSSENE